VVEVGEDAPRDPPGASTRLGASPAAPGARAEIPRGARRWPSPSAPCRCRGEADTGVAKVEPPPLPVRVVGGHRAGDVLLPARAPQRERQAAGACHVANLRLRRSQRAHLRGKEVDPEIPVHRDPRKPS
jgi:hypothetical protein